MNAFRVVIATSVSFAILACSAGSTNDASVSDAGAGADGQSHASTTTPRASINATMGRGTNGTQCQMLPGSWLIVGENTAPASDGDMQKGSKVSVACSVKSEGAGFRVEATVALTGGESPNGSVKITGLFSPSGEQSNVSATFAKEDVDPFVDTNCTATYLPNTSMGIAAGRVWGFLKCPHAASQTRVCDGVAEFKFENCLQ